MPSLVVMCVLYVDRQHATAVTFKRDRGPMLIDSNILGPAAVEEVVFQMSQVEQMRWSIRPPMKGRGARPCHRLCAHPTPLL